MITDQDIPMLPIFSEDARSLLEGFLNRNVIDQCDSFQPKGRLGAGRDGV